MGKWGLPMLWLFQNQEALTAVKKGLEDAAKGRISRVNLDKR